MSRLPLEPRFKESPVTKTLLILLTLAIFPRLSLGAVGSASPRERLSLDKGWFFALGHAYDPTKDFGFDTDYFSTITKAGYGSGPVTSSFDDRGWRSVDVPHDWAAELPFSPEGSRSHGYKALGRKFPGASVGWYRRHFFISQKDLGRRVSVVFDGVQRDAVVWVNGFYLGRETSGYSGFRYDVSELLNYGGDNVVVVRADVTTEEGWFYEGAGIYRHTWLEKTDPLHVAPDGVFVESEVKGDSARLSTEATVRNDGATPVSYEVTQDVRDEDGRSVATGKVGGLKLAPGEEGKSLGSLQVSKALLWSLESPHLYTLFTVVQSGSKVVDRVVTTFGIRTLGFDPVQGFLLNGKHVELKGTCVHQDFAGVGAALPDALQDYRIRALKSFGCNAYRCSHNPPTPELLDACDRLGMLVLDENRLMGVTPELTGRLEWLVKRDRNHPCVFAWSLGNEEWTIEGNVRGERIGALMQAIVKRLDPTRGITAAVSGGWGKGLSEVLEVMGYNYYTHGDLDGHHKSHPQQPSFGSEESSTHSTRGCYETVQAACHLAPADRAGEFSAETSWKHYLARPFLGGLFYWTGFDYRGEPTPFDWPAIGSQYGILDLCGFPKDQAYYLKAWWTDEPVLHLSPHWNWKGREGKPVTVWADSNCAAVELFLNGRSQGRKDMPLNSHLEWVVPYEPGVLSAEGFKDGKPTMETKVETAGPPASLALSADRMDPKADSVDVSVVTVSALDAKGVANPLAGAEATFSLEGPGKIIGVGNGDPSCHEPDQVVDQVTSQDIKNLKFKRVVGWDGLSEVAPGFNDQAWPEGFSFRGRIDGKARNVPMTMVIRGEFTLAPYGPDTVLTFYPKAIGEEQDLYINGKLIVKGLKNGDKTQAYNLEHSILHPGRNTYAMVGTPLRMRWDWDYGNTHPGTIGAFTPHGPWKRSLFNGLAQVLVQTQGTPGEIILKAEAKGLAPAVLKLESKSANLPVAAPSAP